MHPLMTEQPKLKVHAIKFVNPYKVWQFFNMQTMTKIRKRRKVNDSTQQHFGPTWVNFSQSHLFPHQFPVLPRQKEGQWWCCHPQSNILAQLSTSAIEQPCRAWCHWKFLHPNSEEFVSLQSATPWLFQISFLSIQTSTLGKIRNHRGPCLVNLGGVAAVAGPICWCVSWCGRMCVGTRCHDAQGNFCPSTEMVSSCANTPSILPMSSRTAWNQWSLWAATSQSSQHLWHHKTKSTCISCCLECTMLSSDVLLWGATTLKTSACFPVHKCWSKSHLPWWWSVKIAQGCLLNTRCQGSDHKRPSCSVFVHLWARLAWTWARVSCDAVPSWQFEPQLPSSTLCVNKCLSNWACLRFEEAVKFSGCCLELSLSVACPSSSCHWFQSHHSKTSCANVRSASCTWFCLSKQFSVCSSN